VVDNSLDAAEEAGIAPVIEVVVSQDGVVITDNGPGVAPETVSGIIDATAFALDGARGETIIESQGIAHRIGF
jgi:DNA topoisomerase VI subunit B